MQNRADNRADNGYAINLQDIRHRAGRTFRSKGDRTKNQFIARVASEIRDTTSDRAKRNRVVDPIKADLREDVSEMRNVANSDANYRDIQELNIDQAQKQQLKDRVENQILSDQSRIAAQDLDILKGSRLAPLHYFFEPRDRTFPSFDFASHSSCGI